jgi:CHAD domain-containing protein
MEDDRPHAEAVLQNLRQQRNEAFARLSNELDDRRFPALVSRLIDASERPPFTDDSKRKALAAVKPLVAHPWKRLRAAVKDLDDQPSDEALHRVRIKAKRARYALEAAQPVLGKSARRHAKAIADLQGVLGDLHDTVVARQRLRAIGATSTDPQAALVVGALIGWEQAQHDSLRHQWQSAWKRASAKKRLGWRQN